MKLKVRSRMIEKVVGKKQENRVNLKESYSLYDKCHKCPLWVYIDLVCFDDLNVLVIDGKPSEEVLKQAKMNLLVDFSELSESNEANDLTANMKQIYVYKMQIQGLSICYNLVMSDKREQADAYLKKMGIRDVANNKENYLQAIEGHIKSKMINLEQELKKYDSLTKNTDTKKPTPQYYDEQLVALSQFFGYDIDTNITLSKYASYIKRFNQANIKTHGRQ